jgi:hypothetical protein
MKRPRGFHLFFRYLADIEGLDHRAQPPRGGDRLEAGDARRRGSSSLGRRMVPGGGHQHGEELGQRLGGEDHRAVAGDRRLRREDVHHLRQGSCAGWRRATAR